MNFSPEIILKIVGYVSLALVAVATAITAIIQYLSSPACQAKPLEKFSKLISKIKNNGGLQ